MQITVGAFAAGEAWGRRRREGGYSWVFSLSLKSYSSFDIIAVWGRFYSVLEEDLC